MAGRAVILSTGAVIAPFGDPVSRSFFAGQTLAETQDEAFARCRFEVVRVDTAAEAIAAARAAPDGPVVLLLDNVYLSQRAAREFVRTAQNGPRPAALTLTINASVDYVLPLQDVLREGDQVVHDVVLVDRDALPPPEEDTTRWLRGIRDGAHRAVVPKRELVFDVRLPVIGEKDGEILRFPLTSTVVVGVRHWVHILWLNQISISVRWVNLVLRRPLWAIWRALGALSLNRDRLMDRMVTVGPGSTVHPTAYLSRAIVGRDVKIGAHVTIRNSIIGDGAVIEDHCAILNSVVGPRSLITTDTVMLMSCCYPDATVGNWKLQFCLIGENAYVNAWASFIDARFVGRVKVEHEGELVSTERSFLGSVVGHRAQVAAKVLIHPGRAIPNDAIIVMRPDEVVSVVPDDIEPGRPMVRHAGTLVPLGEES